MLKAVRGLSRLAEGLLEEERSVRLENINSIPFF